MHHTTISFTFLSMYYACNVRGRHIRSVTNPTSSYSLWVSALVLLSIIFRRRMSSARKGSGQLRGTQEQQIQYCMRQWNANITILFCYKERLDNSMAHCKVCTIEAAALFYVCINHYTILYTTHVTGKNVVSLQLLHLQKLTIHIVCMLNNDYCKGRRLHGIMLVIILCTGEKEVAHKWGLIASICRKASNNDCSLSEVDRGWDSIECHCVHRSVLSVSVYWSKR